MSRTAASTLVLIATGSACAGCATAPQPASYASAGYHAAGVGVSTVKSTGMDLYHGAGQAIRAPLHDLNMMQDQIPPVLLRAENRPYDLSGIDRCGDVLDKVAELDLALGPDVDMPKENRRTRASRGADFTASAALDAAGSAVEHFIPMRGTIKQISGATRYENHAKHAVLAGEVRRSFLKAVGMAHSCAWPAAPLSFHAVQVADVDASWTGASATSGTSVAAAAAPIQPAVLTTSLAAAPDPSALRVTPEAIRTPRATPPAIDPQQAWAPAVLKTARYTVARAGASKTVTAASLEPDGTAAASSGAATGSQSVVKVSTPGGSPSSPWSVGFASAR